MHGHDVAEHEKHLTSLLERCKEKNIRLSKDKLCLRSDRVTFMGHLITKEGLQLDPAKLSAITEMPAPEDKEGYAVFWAC